MNARLTARFLVLGTCALGIGPIAAGAQSADDGFADPNPSGAVRAMAVQPDGKILIGGSFVTLGGSEDHPYLGRINADGSFDSTFDPSRGGGQGIALGQVNALLVQPDGKVLVGSSGWIATGGVQYWNVQRFQSDGTVDPDFNPGANRDVLALAVQPDGKILVGGSFTMLGDGGTGSTPRSHLGRLNPDGSLDATFDPVADGDVSAITVQPDGGILVSGGFTMLGGGGTGSTPRSHLGRLNSDGSLDISFDPGADDHVNALALQADGKIWVGGDFSMLGGGGSGSMPRRHLGRLNPDGSLDGVDPSVSGLSVSVLNIGPDGKVLVGGFFYTVTSSWYVHQNIARLNPDGSVDEGFAALTNSDGQVFALAVQPDQKIVLGGGFSIVAHNGHGEIVSRQNLGRLYPDGSVDVAFTPGVTSSQGTVRAVAVQPDGKILLGGSFTMSFLHAPNCSNLCRFYPDGSPDVTFGANAAPNGSVNSLAVQPNGKILVGGYFTGLGQAMNNQIGRLLPDGSNDGTFFAGGGAGSGYGVWALALRPDPTSADGWSIVVGGDFTTFNGVARSRLALLYDDGSLNPYWDGVAFGVGGTVQAVAVQPDGKVVVGGDFMLPHQNLARFQPASIFGVELDPSFYPDASDTVHALALQPDGRILVGGRFTSLGRSEIWMDRVHIGRLNPDGSIDSFNPGANGNVLSVALQADGKILVGGTFIGLGGGYGTTPRSRLGRFMPDGSVDGWDPGANDQVYALAIETDGKVLIGGIFTKLGGGGSGSSTRTSVGRLTSGSPAMESLSVTGGNVVTWARSGAEPEVSSVTFESSSDGLTYTTLGTGAHVPGGWELVVPNLPTNQNVFIRARGSQVNGAYFGGSTSTHESVSLFYLLDPTTLSGNAGEAVEGLVRDR